MAKPKWSNTDQRVHLRRMTIHNRGINIAWCGIAIPVRAGRVTARALSVTCEGCKTEQANAEVT